MDPSKHITENFTWVEMNIDPRTAAKVVADNAMLLCTRLLQPLRARLGRIDVTSAYRPGAKHSDHDFLAGAAVDVHLAVQISGLDGAQRILDAARADNLPFDQIIGYLPGIKTDPAGEHTHLGWRAHPRYQVLLAFPGPDGTARYRPVKNFTETP